MDASLKYKLNVMQKALSGSAIEFKLKTDDDKKYAYIYTPSWNWDKYDYRVKPEPKYVPFKTPQEVFDAMKVHGEWIKNDEFARIKRVTSLTCEHDGMSFEGASAEYMVKQWRFLDGTPFGKEETK